MKTFQLAKIDNKGKRFSIVYHSDDKYTPYWIYRHTWGIAKSGYGCREHKRIEIKYTDIKSCLLYIANEM